MTQRLQHDNSLTDFLIDCVDKDVSWLRHGSGAGRLDWALLFGGTDRELSEIRGGWRGHILHLQREHAVRVLQDPPGFYRMVRQAGAPAGDMPVGLQAPMRAETEAEESDDAPDLGNGGEETPKQPQSLRSVHTARVIVALHECGELRNPMHKASIGMLIRQVSECNHWHNSAHYRSRSAAALIANASIRSAAAYNRFCSRNLRHEHMVPNSVLYRMIVEEQNPTVDWLVDLFARYSFRATITREEDSKLRPSEMPPGFYEPGHAWYDNPLARYMETGLVDELIERTTERWFPS